MNIYTHHREIRIILTALGEAFNGLIIRRTSSNQHEDIIDNISVPVLYSPKTRVLHELVNLSKHIKLPMFCYNLKNISYDAQRTFNKLDGFYVSRKIDENGTKYPQPVPIKMTINTSFLARFQDDCDQFITNLYTFTTPYFVISYIHPDVGVEVRCKVTWDGNATLNYPEDLDATKAYRTEVDSTFTVEAWLYKNVDKADGLIYNIPVSFTALPEVSDDSEWMHRQQTVDNTDWITASGRPWVRDSDRTSVYTAVTATPIKLNGNMFDSVTGIAFVDTDPDVNVFPASAYEPFDYYSGDHTLSAYNPPFTGVPGKFTIVDDKDMFVTVPQTVASGYFDVVALGKYGTGKLTKDSFREYMIGQKPTVSGIESIVL